MFQKIESTVYPPQIPTLVWDGDCTFCKFWKTRWEMRTNGKLSFKPYQQVTENFPDIPVKEFKKASRFIDTDGQIYSGPDSAYRSLYVSGNSFWHKLYRSQRWFEWLSDFGYNHIAKNRSFYYKMTINFFGKNPQRLRYYWVLYLIGLCIFMGWLHRCLL
ncbi:DUF393 domain-containing protein [Dokdonia sinensis]|uniref:DUF393 domain-containing protein n=1 Tax=Dokdonia sinensis TaxID=2479847 RepID=A0A3M0G1L2_9FLAO|nr:DCC1-like thiol-disulfide oxidoreductase family protein [Dokdonia sinensis]RMB56072.1 DUF393 domain-containing protein [Dokdonia sinensis]